MNLFEQQALMQKRLAPRPAQPAGGDRPALDLRLIESASLDQCGKIAIRLSARLFTLEKQYSGMKAANLNEAAHFVADAALDIDGAMKAGEEAPCGCGQCDNCVAARSDEHYGRQRDGAAPSPAYPSAA